MIINKIWKIVRTFGIVILSLVAFAIIGVVLFTQVKSWIYTPSFVGNDIPQYIHFVFYYSKNLHLPFNAWDYFWHNGAPRIVDTSWLHYTLVAVLFKVYRYLSSSKIISGSYLFYWSDLHIFILL